MRAPRPPLASFGWPEPRPRPLNLCRRRSAAWAASSSQRIQTTGQPTGGKGETKTGAPAPGLFAVQPGGCSQRNARHGKSSPGRLAGPEFCIHTPAESGGLTVASPGRPQSMFPEKLTIAILCVDEQGERRAPTAGWDRNCGSQFGTEPEHESFRGLEAGLGRLGSQGTSGQRCRISRLRTLQNERDERIGCQSAQSLRNGPGPKKIIVFELPSEATREWPQPSSCQAWPRPVILLF